MYTSRYKSFKLAHVYAYIIIGIYYNNASLLPQSRIFFLPIRNSSASAHVYSRRNITLLLHVHGKKALTNTVVVLAQRDQVDFV